LCYPIRGGGIQPRVQCRSKQSIHNFSMIGLELERRVLIVLPHSGGGNPTPRSLERRSSPNEAWQSILSVLFTPSTNCVRLAMLHILPRLLLRMPQISEATWFALTLAFQKCPKNVWTRPRCNFFEIISFKIISDIVMTLCIYVIQSVCTLHHLTYL